VIFEPYVTVWVWIGTIYLLILTWQDYKNNMKIDDRHNYFMLGITFGMLIIQNLTFLYVFISIAINVILLIIVSKSLGGGDRHSMLWVLNGFAFIHPALYISYLLSFLAISIIYIGIIRLIRKKLNIYQQHFPFYPVILISFIITNIYYLMY